jgi:hypothetical protein
MKIIKPSFLSENAIKLVENTYKAKYVCDTCLRDVTCKNNVYINSPFAVFYTETPHPKGSNWFAVYNDGLGFSITNAITATEPFSGICISALDKEDVIVYSRYRHDMQVYDDVTVDGGRDYLKCSQVHSKVTEVKLQIIKDRLVVI